MTRVSWETCDDCHDLGRIHVSHAELLADPIGTWRQMWSSTAVAVRWFDHPCDGPNSTRAWAVFGPWGVDEVAHSCLQESHRITPEEAVAALGDLAGGKVAT